MFCHGLTLDSISTSSVRLQDFVQNKSGYLQTQVGNPEGADKPNKKVRARMPMAQAGPLTVRVQYYDPRVWVREGEKTLVERVKEANADLGNTSQYLSLSLLGCNFADGSSFPADRL